MGDRSSACFIFVNLAGGGVRVHKYVAPVHVPTRQINRAPDRHLAGLASLGRCGVVTSLIAVVVFSRKNNKKQ